MDTLYQIVVVLHWIGLTLLIVGYLLGLRGGAVVNPLMLWGARLQVITGLALVGIAEGALDAELNHAKIGVKLAVALAVAALTEIANAKARRGVAGDTVATRSPLVHAAAGLAVVNVLVATLWN